MGKLHHISSERFSMNQNGEIMARFGMSIECRVKSGWGQDGDLVEFYYNDKKLSGPETMIGDVIFMDHDGPRTSWVIGKKPRDPRLSLLWEFGYRASTRVRVDDPSVAAVCYGLRKKAFGTAYTEGPSRYNSAWNEAGCFIGDGFKSPTIIKNAKGDVLVALYSGRVFGADTSFCQWFMNEATTLDDVKSALLADYSLNQKHPLLQ